MAKKAKLRVPAVVVDEQGYKTDGMYTWGGPPIPATEETLKAWVDDFNREFHKPAGERIAEFREACTRFISPYVDGPLSAQTVPSNRRVVSLNLTTGRGCYAFREEVLRGCWLDDVADMLRTLDELEVLIAHEQPNIDHVVRVSVCVGMLFIRMQLRAGFSRDVLTAKKRRQASAKGGKATAKWTPHIEAIAREIFAKEKRGKASKDAAYRRTAARLHAEHGISVSRSTLQRRLDQPNA
jgi:hypothetical protein